MAGNSKNTVVGRGSGRLHWAHWAVIALSLVLTLSAWYYAKSQAQEKVERRFDREAMRVIDLVRERMRKYEDALWSGVALHHADRDGEIEYAEWVAFANSIRIEEKYPGINGIGVIDLVRPGDLASYIAEQREHRPDFSVHPEHGEDEYWPITYIEPVETNRQAVGLDMAHETNRRTAAKKARDTGEAQITGPIVLVQDANRTPGFLFYAPFYEGRDHPEAGERAEKIRGLVYAPFVVKRLMEGVLDKQNRQVGVRITDDEENIYDELIPDEPDYDDEPLHRTTLRLPIYGRTWEFDIASGLSFRAASANMQPAMILGGGIIIDLLLLLLFIALTRSNRNAVRYADAASRDLKEANRDLRLILDAVPSYIYFKDANNKILNINKAAAGAIRLSAEDALGRQTEEFFPAEDAAAYLVDDREVIATGEAKLGIEEFHQIGADERRLFRTDKFPIKNEIGECDRVVAVATDITDLRAAQEELAEAQARFERAVDGSNDGLWDYDPASGAVWYSDRFKELIGYAPDEYDRFEHVLESWTCLLHPEDKQPTWEAVEAHMRGEAPYDVRYRLFTKKGVYRWFRARGVAHRDERGEVYRMSGSIQDITELSRIESDLQKNSQFTSAILASSDYLIISTDVNGVVVSFNPAAERELGYSSEEIIGRTTPAIWHDMEEVVARAGALSKELGCDVEPGFEVFVAKTRDTGKADENEWTFIRKDGSRFPVSLSVTCLRGTGSELLGYVGVIRNLTAEREAQRKLDESNERLDLAVQGTNDGIWDWRDINQTQEWWSPRFYELLGYEPGEIEASHATFISLLHPDHHEMCSRAVDEALAGVAPFDVEYLLRTKYQGYRWFRSRAKVFYDDDKKPTRMAGSIQDIDERKQTERALSRTNQELERFVYTASHDLKSPIVTILGYTSHLMRDIEAGRSEELGEYGRRIRRAAERMRSNVDDLLQLSRVGRVVMNPEALDVAEVVGHAVAALQGQIEEQGVRIETSIEQGTVWSDRSHMDQVVTNLLVNALAYGCVGDSPEVRVSTRDLGDGFMELGVDDDGPGISPEYAERVFGLFERLSSDKKGTGVGLAIVRRVAELYGGQAWVKPNPGGGARLRVTLPVREITMAGVKTTGEAQADVQPESTDPLSAR